MELGHHHGYVLAHPGEAREPVAVLDDPVHVTDPSARAFAISAMSDLMLELCVFQL